CLFLDRSSAKAGLKTILQAIDYAKNGTSIFIFPEGTRSKDGTVAEFKAGSFKIAEKSGVPVIPVAFYNTESIFEKQKPYIKAAKVTMEYGDPIYIDELPKEEKKKVNEMARGAILEMLNQK
ncbi:MAG TPA: 1-acyl-sn-glycerol-3-phosphate acyltransferase, partial [Eubacterium sp.]|nr:1-acyl-sn-glycerol-3-phosphate acyltransferase [Eubacterium sp.]